jgi:hypothetical protein
VEVPHVQGDELGAPAAAGEAQAEQRPVPAVARVFLAHRLDQGAQGVDQDGVFLLRRDPDSPADTLEHLGHLGRLAGRLEAMELVGLGDRHQGALDGGDGPLRARQGGQVEGDRAGQGGHRGELLRLAPAGERYEVGRVGPLGVLGAGGAGVGGRGVVELAGLRDELGAGGLRAPGGGSWRASAAVFFLAFLGTAGRILARRMTYHYL